MLLRSPQSSISTRGFSTAYTAGDCDGNACPTPGRGDPHDLAFRSGRPRAAAGSSTRPHTSGGTRVSRMVPDDRDAGLDRHLRPRVAAIPHPLRSLSRGDHSGTISVLDAPTDRGALARAR